MEATESPTPRKRERRIVRNGGLSMVIGGVLVLLTLPLIPTLIPSLAPATVQAGLQALQSQGTVYVTTWILYLASDLLYLVAFPALYYVLKTISRPVLLLAVVLNTLFVVLDARFDIPLRLYLVQLSDSYLSASSTSQQASVLSSAQFVMNAANLLALVATLLQFSAVIGASFVILKSGRFRKSIGYIGIATGVVSILFVPAFVAGSQLAGLFNIGGFVLLVVWSLTAGLRLHRLAKSPP